MISCVTGGGGGYSHPNEREFLSLGGIGKTSLFNVSLHSKMGDEFIDAEIAPYVIRIEEHAPYPRANLIFEDTIRAVDIGIELNGRKYAFNNQLQLLPGEMKTNLGLYLPLTWSEYHTGDDLNLPVMGLDGTIDRSPMYLFCSQNDADNFIVGFMLQDGGLHCFKNLLNLSKEKENVIRGFASLSSSMLLDRIKISPRNLEGKVSASFRTNPLIKTLPDLGKENPSVVDWKNPKSVVEYLDKYIVGQSEAKKRIAIALKKYRTRIETGDESIEKGNVLLIGPTGTGKTYMMSLLAEGQKIPFVSVKAVAKSQTGYVGENLSSAIFKQLLAKMRIDTFEPNKIYTPEGIVFIDEFDKLGSNRNTREFFSTSLQQEIVGWAENDIVSVEVGQGYSVLINTKHLLFVGAGAFGKVEGKYESLTEVIDKRVNPKKNEIGFRGCGEEKTYECGGVLSFVKEEDLEKYGLMLELIGRFTERAVLNPLSLEELATIFHKVDNSIYASYKKIFEYDGYKLEMDEDVPLLIAQNCSTETGARAMKSIAATIFNEIIYNPDDFKKKGSKTIRLTSKVVNSALCNAH